MRPEDEGQNGNRRTKDTTREPGQLTTFIPDHLLFQRLIK